MQIAVAVGLNLEHQTAERLVRFRVADELHVGLLGIHAFDCRHVGRAGQIEGGRVEHRLHADSVQGRAAEHRHHQVVDRRLAEHLVDQCRRHGLVGEHQFGQPVAIHRKLVEHLAVPQLGLVAQFGGDLGLDNLGPLALGGKGEHPHRNQVDETAEGFFQVRRAGADGQIDGDRPAIQTVADFVERAEVIGPSRSILLMKAIRGTRYLSPGARRSRSGPRPLRGR